MFRRADRLGPAWAQTGTREGTAGRSSTGSVYQARGAQSAQKSVLHVIQHVNVRGCESVNRLKPLEIEGCNSG